jgi:undecaprenyl diphosphate synthase
MASATRAQEHRATGIVPRHIAIIMDGNGRWAQQRHLPRLVGHRQGTNNIHPIVEACDEMGVAVLTLYAFSTENWGRPEDEVSGLMKIFLEISRRETLALHRKGVHVQQIGSLEGVNPALQQAIQDADELTRHNTGLVLNIAFNYGGRAEIVNAVRAMMAAGVRPEEVTEEALSRYLYTAGLPDPDLVIRTAGEMRLSNFLLWQAAYAEYYSTDKLWPDFTADDLRAAVAAFASRKRKYGRL